MDSSNLSVPFTFSEPYEFAGDTLVDTMDGKVAWTYTAEIKEEIPKIYNMEVRKDDLWVAGYPKSGTTWLTEIVYTVFYGGTKEAKEKRHLDRWCYPEMNAYVRMGAQKMPEADPQKDFFKEAVECESPRMIRTNLPFSLLPPKLLDTCKVVYICRNLKDVAISFFKMIEGIDIIGFETVEAFIDSFMSGKGMCQPACEFIKEAWEKRQHPNMLFLYYEDLKKDVPGELHKIAAFLGKSLSDDQVKDLENHLSVESMKKNKNINMEDLKKMGLLGEKSDFIRKGISGDWKNYFTPTTLEKWDKWLSEQMADTDFKYKE